MSNVISNRSFSEQRRQRRRPRLVPNPKARLREQLAEVMRFLHFSARTEETYWQWVVKFLRFHRGKFQVSSDQVSSRSGAHGVTRPTDEAWRHPRELGAAEVSAFLSHLASEKQVAAATQNQALNALVFLYSEVLHQPLGELGEFARVNRPARLPEVLSREETLRVLESVAGESGLALRLLYGSGLRLFECLRLRIKDVDLERGLITVRDGKGFKDRATMVPVA